MRDTMSKQEWLAAEKRSSEKTYVEPEVIPSYKRSMWGAAACFLAIPILTLSLVGVVLAGNGGPDVGNIGGSSFGTAPNFGGTNAARTEICGNCSRSSVPSRTVTAPPGAGGMLGHI